MQAASMTIELPSTTAGGKVRIVHALPILIALLKLTVNANKSLIGDLFEPINFRRNTAKALACWARIAMLTEKWSKSTPYGANNDKDAVQFEEIILNSLADPQVNKAAQRSEITV